MQNFSVATESTFTPTDQMQIQFFFELLRNQAVSDRIHYHFEVAHNLRDGLC